MRSFRNDSDKTYRAWAKMKSRCDNPKDSRYSDYGGRGITYESRWVSFNNFFVDMGDCPEGKSLDRIDNEGNYTLENCRWATREQQQRNTRRTVLSEEIVKCGRALQDAGKQTDRQIARDLSVVFNVKSETIRETLKGRTWKKEKWDD